MEVRIFGPPGTGKTTYLSRQISIAADKHGGEKILVASFTKAAAVELASRDLMIPRENIGTLHRHCYHVLGTPEIAETHIDDFNTEFPQYALSEAAKLNFDESAVDMAQESKSDRVFTSIQVYRHKLVPRNLWPMDCRQFWKVWEAWKDKNHYIDFTDMIELAMFGLREHPGGHTVGIFDEVQDFTPLELSLVRKWGDQMETFLLAGDDDQCLYDFKGATADAFLDPPVSREQKRILTQSYRVPRVIHNLAERWIHLVRRREPKNYQPRDFEGEIILDDVSFKTCEKMIPQIEAYLAKEKSVMVLASCGYMLDGLKATLRANGIPFHNPYRKSRGDWNPLGSGRGVSMKDRLLAFLSEESMFDCGEYRLWSKDSFIKWVEIIKAKNVLAHGGKTFLQAFEPDAFPPMDDYQYLQSVDKMFLEGVLPEAAKRDMTWFIQNVLESKRRGLEFPVRIAQKRGIDALKVRPRVCVGTIHSVKGGQSDVVYLFPDVSVAGMQQWSSRSDGHDAVLRQFYVGMTRAREILHLCKPSSRSNVSFKC